MLDDLPKSVKAYWTCLEKRWLRNFLKCLCKLPPFPYQIPYFPYHTEYLPFRILHILTAQFYSNPITPMQLHQQNTCCILWGESPRSPWKGIFILLPTSKPVLPIWVFLALCWHKLVDMGIWIKDKKGDRILEAPTSLPCSLPYSSPTPAPFLSPTHVF